MAIPDWFDPAYYAAQKVQQMNAIRYLGHDGWDLASYTQELLTWQDAMGNGLPGDSADEKAYANFLACNGSGYTSWIGQGAINVSCTSYFDIPVYLQNLAAAANRGSLSLGSAPAGGWTAENVLLHLLHDLHTSAWDHYTTTGAAAGINPSNEFDTNAWFTARATAMNEWQDGRGWLGRTDWTAEDVAEDLRSRGINPVQDLDGQGGNTLHVEVAAPATATQVPESFSNQWQPILPPDPYELNVTTVEMSQGQSLYSGISGHNTRFEGNWTNSAATSTISPADIIQGGANAYNTLAIALSASWPGFSGQTSGIGRLELNHATANPSAPYTFDAANINGLERIDLNAAGAGAISITGLQASVQTVNISDLEGGQTTGIGFASGAVAGGSDALTVGVANVGAQGTPASINLAGVENLTVNATEGQNYVNLRGATGVQTLNVTGMADLTITGTASGITAYDASGAHGNMNIAASDLQPETIVRGGFGWDTLTLSQNFTGTPLGWSGIEALALNPGASATISGANISGLQNLWLHSVQSATIQDLPATGRFIVYQANSGGNQLVTVNGDIASLAYSTTGYAAAENGSAAPRFSSTAQRDVDIHATGQTTLAGSFNLSKAAGDVSLIVQKDATFGAGTITAPEAGSFTASIEGNLAAGATFNVVDGRQGGKIAINAQNGILSAASAPGQLTLNADGAATVSINSGGAFALSSASSLQAAQTLTISLSGTDASFNAAGVAFAQARDIQINGDKGAVNLGDLGSNSLNDNIQLTVDKSGSFSSGTMQTGGSGNILANVAADETASFGNVRAGGDVQLAFQCAGVAANGGATVRAGGHEYIDFGQVSGDAFSGGAPLRLNAGENINYIGAQGADTVAITGIGGSLPSSIQLGAGADTLTIAAAAVASGEAVTLTIDAGNDTNADSISIQAQASGAMLSVYLNEFREGQDSLQFAASSLSSVSQAQALLSAFGVSNANVTQSMLCKVGNGTGVIYDGDAYVFNSATNASTMVVIVGAEVDNGAVNIAGAPEAAGA